MKEQFRIHKVTRQNACDLVEYLETEQINHIPTGFNNNIIWNLGHMLVTQQLLLYKLSGNEIKIEKGLIERFRNGTKPEKKISSAEVLHIIDLMKSTSEHAETDYAQGLFKSFRSTKTKYRYEMTSIDEAILFNNIHEAMHLGTMLSLSKLVRSIG